MMGEHYTIRKHSTTMSLALFPARTQEALEEVRRIFIAYAHWIADTLHYPLSVQGFETELASLPGRYAPPSGDILVAEVDGNIAGAIAYYTLSEGVAELKRFYVMPEYAAHGVGGALFSAMIEHCRAAGFRSICLDTLSGMVHARKLYARHGFREVAPYNDNHLTRPDLLYYQLDLGTN